MTQQYHSWAYTPRKSDLKETRAPQCSSQHYSPRSPCRWATVRGVTESDTTEWLALSLSNTITYTPSPPLDEEWPLVWLVVIHFTCLKISFIPHYCTVSTFHHSSQFVLKTESFHYRFACRNVIKKVFLPTYVEPKLNAINITKLVQMIFNSWFGYFEHVTYLLCDIMLTVLN